MRFVIHCIGISEKADAITIVTMTLIEAPISCRYHIMKLNIRDSAIPSTKSTERKLIMFTSQHIYAKVFPNFKHSDFLSFSFNTAPTTKDTAPKKANI
ncbi:hypothetical protein P5673_020654 [Acropora cervicornis]|uniref:Uncharacterized protein n=1 Tax=Acropora cervicornis TaxID=6130 RepID=A0AAD9Q9L0_ACRCE|nr:hypothetical protein P5673_020654 [Acropora cervicornis]